jgi:twitching motility protein PilT
MSVDFAEIILAALERRSSDIHLTAGAPPNIRVRGRLLALEGFPVLDVQDTREIVYSILSDTQRQTFENQRQVDFSYSVPRTARLRVNAYMQRGAVSAALRVIPSDIKSLEQLGMPQVVREMAGLPRGIVLVTGPTGSGKSTTLAAVIDEINNSREDHILTIEDPIEFLHSHKRCLVNQRELGSDATSFSEGLRAALREDPDVILVGEMRDLETISTALTAAETGHLVLATLHTQDAPQTIDRVIDVFPPHQQQHVRVMLSVALQGVVAQQLLPTADGSGRVPAVEVLIPTPAVRNLIREGKTHQIYSAIQTGGEHGMQTMDAALTELVRAGRISRDQARRRASVPAELARLLGDTVTVAQGATNGYLQ